MLIAKFAHFQPYLAIFHLEKSISTFYVYDDFDPIEDKIKDLFLKI